jgi:hypothetical protein
MLDLGLHKTPQNSVHATFSISEVCPSPPLVLLGIKYGQRLANMVGPSTSFHNVGPRYENSLQRLETEQVLHVN